MFYKLTTQTIKNHKIPKSNKFIQTKKMNNFDKVDMAVDTLNRRK